MAFYTTGLSPAQLRVLPHVGGCAGRYGFYLGGGTAVSIYFGHRGSDDLDWFSSESLGDPMQFAQILRDDGIPFVTDSTAPGTLYGSVENVRMSFLEYRYPLLGPLAQWEEGGCSLASLDDLACMKLVAIAQRGSRKDFIDLFVLVQRYKPLTELLGLYRQKYGVENVATVLMGLVYFDDADHEPDPELWAGNWEEIKQTFTGWVRKAG
jgi:hypothetical protein